MRHIDDELRRTASTQNGLVRMADARDLGISRDAIHGDLRVGRLTRVHRGVYAVPGSDDELHSVRAAHLHLGPESTAVLGSALLLHEISGVAGHRPPEFAMPPGLERRQRDRIDLRFWRIPDDQLTCIAGIRATSIVRTLSDTCRLLPRMQAVATVDSALHLGLITVDDIPRVAALMSRKPNAVAGRRHVAEARTGAQSPLETRVRLRADDAGLRPDALQVPILSPARILLGYGDIGYALGRDRWLIIEADGRSVHEQPEAVLHDRHRQNAFLAHGNAQIVRFTWEDTRDPAYIPTVLRPLLNAARWRPSRRP
jgi:hypothetical protein